MNPAKNSTIKNLRMYGVAPYTVAVIHGGPGAPGEMAPVAKQLSKNVGVLEPFQKASSVRGQTEELYTILEDHSHPPMTLIGFSWGAWLSYIFTNLHPAFVKKLILISCSPFEEKDAIGIMRIRLSRLNREEKKEINSLQEALQDPSNTDKNTIFARFGELMFKADSYDPLPYKNNVIRFDYECYQHIWREAIELRQSVKLFYFGKNIQCLVVALHGEYDPHPAYAIKNSLSRVCKDFRFILLKDCGHYPWMEKLAYEKFYDTLHQEVEGSR
jgi:pimeloyl-ACP methyl ester carboxylesterase